jgi:hypothetical protein
MLFTVAVGVAAFGLTAAPFSRLLHVAVPPAADAEETETPIPGSDRIPLVPELHSRWYTQTNPPALTPGEVTDVTIQFRNVGLTPWIKGSPSEIRLGEIGPRPLPPAMRVDWRAFDRPAVQHEAIVYEQQLATFTFQIKGAALGTFRLNVRPVVDGVAWLNEEGVFVDITVESPEPASGLR